MNILCTTRTLVFAAALFGLALSPVALAETTYQYTGSPLSVRSENDPGLGGGTWSIPAGSYANCGSESIPMPCRVSGFFTVAEPLTGNLTAADISAQVTHFSFSDGRDTLLYWNDPDNLPNPVDPEHFAIEILVFRIWTDASAVITSWDIYVKHDLYIPDIFDPDPSQNPLGRQRHTIHTESHPRYRIPGTSTYVSEWHEDYAMVTECGASRWKESMFGDRWDCFMHIFDEGQIMQNPPGTWTVESDDTDGDGVPDTSDNCPTIGNPDQEDNDTDGIGDACDDDDDNDTVADSADNCPFVANPDQADLDEDGIGDACDTDWDGDGVTNDVDICPNDFDPDQTDTDTDGTGDACDDNDDNDAWLDAEDNCPTVVNDDQADLDEDGIGDACDADWDGDGVPNDVDNCPATYPGSGDQTDTDLDSLGDVCDPDDDNDTVLDDDDNCPLAANTSQTDSDGDGIGDVCNDAFDADGDEWSDALDNCPNVANGDQADFDYDFIGDACDDDVDGDGVANALDDCALTPLGEVVTDDGCTIEQLVPCDGPRGTTTPWKNHGKYVSAVARAANEFRDQGLITGSEHGQIVSGASQSTCGEK